MFFFLIRPLVDPAISDVKPHQVPRKCNTTKDHTQAWGVPYVKLKPATGALSFHLHRCQGLYDVGSVLVIPRNLKIQICHLWVLKWTIGSMALISQKSLTLSLGKEYFEVARSLKTLSILLFCLY